MYDVELYIEDLRRRSSGISAISQLRAYVPDADIVYEVPMCYVILYHHILPCCAPAAASPACCGGSSCGRCLVINVCCCCGSGELRRKAFCAATVVPGDGAPPPLCLLLIAVVMLTRVTLGTRLLTKTCCPAVGHACLLAGVCIVMLHFRSASAAQRRVWLVGMRTCEHICIVIMRFSLI